MTSTATEVLARIERAVADRYRVQREIGSGGMAKVYLAFDLKHRRPVAIKVLLPELSNSINAERFLLEIRTAARLVHPNILPLHDSGDAAGLLFYIMPFVQGESLRHLLNRSEVLAVEHAVRIGCEVAGALDYAHEHSIIHRDIKPENILLSGRGQAVIADFGLAQALSSVSNQRATASGTVVGSPLYMSPEQAAGEDSLDGRTDIYGLGCVLYEMLAGVPPFGGESLQEILHQHWMAPPPSVRAARADAPSRLDRAVRKAMAKKREERFATAGELEDALKNSVKGGLRGLVDDVAGAFSRTTTMPTPARPPSPPLRSSRPVLHAASPFEPSFVGRESALGTLTEALRKSLDGTGQICFVAGDPGSGKTMLVLEFAQHAEQVSESAVVAFADCNVTTGRSDPFLPFRELLSLLQADTGLASGARLISEQNAERLRMIGPATARALATYGPDLRFGRASASPEPVRRLEPNQMLEQLTNVIRAVAQQSPLLLIIDDLHWADQASIDLLFHLARRIEASPILIVGTYRPSDIALGRGGTRHPLETPLHELKRYSGSNSVDLTDEPVDERRAFLDQLLDRVPNAFTTSFRAELLDHTEGQPLFAVELLRALSERGALARDASGRWFAKNVDWDVLPSRVEGVIEERLSRVEPTALEYLMIAGVEGEAFTAEVVARVAGADDNDIVRAFSSTLARQHRLVRAEGTFRIGQRSLTSYRFRHNLFQRFIYNSLDLAERSRMHAAVATALREFHEADLDRVALQLAHHYELSHQNDAAVEFLMRAANLAERQHAYRAALEHIRRAEALQGTDDGAALVIRREILEKVADLQRLTGALNEAIATYERAIELGSMDSLVHARLHHKIGKTLSDQHRGTEALDRFVRATGILEGERSENAVWWEEWLQVHIDQMWVLYTLSRTSELSTLIEILRPQVDQWATPTQRIEFLGRLLAYYLRSERYRLSDASLAVAVDFVARARALGAEDQIAVTEFQLGIAYFCDRRVKDAEPLFRASLDFAERAAAASLQISNLTYLAFTRRLDGDVTAARDYATAALQLASTAGPELYLAAAQANLAWVAYKTSDLVTARDLAATAVASWQAGPSRYPFIWAGVLPLMAASLDTGDIAGAAQAARSMVGSSILDTALQELEEKITEPMRTGLAAWERGDAATAATDFRRACQAAIELRLL